MVDVMFAWEMGGSRACKFLMKESHNLFQEKRMVFFLLLKRKEKKLLASLPHSFSIRSNCLFVTYEHSCFVYHDTERKSERDNVENADLPELELSVLVYEMQHIY